MNCWDETVDLMYQLESMKSVPSNDFLLNLFKQIRKSKMMRSDIIIKYGPSLVKSIYDEREGTILIYMYLKFIYHYLLFYYYHFNICIYMYVYSV